MAAAVVTASLKNVSEAFDVCIDIGVRIFKRVANTRLGREMNNDGETMLREQRFRRCAIGQIELHKAEIRMTPENVEASFFEPGIVVIVDDVQTDDLASAGQQPLGDMESDKAGGPG